MVSPQILMHDEGEQFNQHTTQRHELGQLMMLPDGRFFRYALAGEAIAVAKLCTTVLVDADLDELVIPTAEPLLNSDGTKNQSIGITLGAGEALAANDLQEGYVLTEDDAGEGFLYKARDHAAAAGAALATINLHPNIGLQVALSVATTVAAIRNPYKGVLIFPATTPTAVPAGVTCVALVSGQYGWLQVWGPCAVLTVGTLVVGQPAVIPTATAGGVGPPTTADTELHVGWVQSVSATTEHSLVFLRIM